MTRNSQCGFRKEKSLLTKLIAFYDEMTGSVDKRRPVDVVYLGVKESFDTVSHSTLLDSLMKYGLDK